MLYTLKVYLPVLFNSIGFYLIFLPVTLALFCLIRNIGCLWAVQGLLIVASLIFYSGHGFEFLGLLAGSVVMTWLISLAIAMVKKAGNRKTAKVLTGLAIFCHLSLIGYFKYRNFFVESAVSLTGSHIELPPVILPLAISFFTFQQIGYLADVYKCKIKPPSNPLDFFLFVTFFPQLIAGPITLYQELQPQFSKRLLQENFARCLIVGATMFAIGLAKKVGIADQAAYHASIVFDAADAGMSISIYDSWMGALAFTTQIYFDFSGYCDMACGLALMFGMRVPMNFFSPYQATSITAFWRRWHISLSRFLRDYVYIPLGGNRGGRRRTVLNLFVTMLIGGLWHGAAWTFVFWGALHGAYLVIAGAWRQAREKHAWRLPPITGWGLTFLAIVIAWVFFRARTFDGALIILSGMAGLGVPGEKALLSGLANFTNENGSIAGPWVVPAGLAVAFLMPNAYQMLRKFRVAIDIYGHIGNHNTEKAKHGVWFPMVAARKIFARLAAIRASALPTAMAFFVLLTLLLATAYQAMDGSYSEFIYFNF